VNARALAPAIAIALLTAAPAVRAQAKNGIPARIDFRALTDDGGQVTDLKADEITLKVNGKPRQIQSLSLFRTTADSGARSELPPPYASNAVGTNGRAIYILIDDDSIAPGREGQFREAVRLIASELGPGDRIGVLTPQGQVNIQPGPDATRVRLAVDGLAGRGSPNESEQDSQCRSLHLLRALGTMLSLTGGTPTTIVVFSAGMSPPAVKQVLIGAANRTTATSDVCPVTPQEFQNIGSLAATAHADLYLFLLTEGMVARSSTQDAGFESLAGVMGAEMFRLAANPNTAVSRMLRETGAYYVATFDPEPAERNGQPLRVELRASRDKVKLRTRPAVEVPKDSGRAAVSPKDMLRVAGERHDLPLRAAAYSSRTPGSDEVKIVALFEGTEPEATLASASVGLFDERNTLKKQWTAQAADLAKRPVMAALSAPEGTYRLRVAAIDASGRAGTTDYELKAEVPRADPLRLSALVLGTQQGGGFAPRLEFSSEPTAIGLLEIYGVPKSGTVTVTLDVVSSPEGPALATAQATVAQGSSEDMRTAFGGFSIATLPPGDYLMRAIVVLDNKPVGKVVRTLRKTR
jgi:hypothetical protein